MARAFSDVRSAGFALVEALASLVIVGMISMMLIEGVGTGRRVWERIDAREASGEAIDGAQSVLRDRIEQIYAATLFNKNPPYVDFSGKADRLVFIATPPQSARPAPLRRYSLVLDTAGELVLSSVSDVAPDISPVARDVLLTGVRQVDVAYYGPSAPDFTPQWRRSWDDETALPQAIRVRLTFEPGDQRRWPDLIVHPKASVDVACMLNTVTHLCKGRQ